VSIYTGGAYADKADIVWVAECWPSAPVSGRSIEGAHINMCDVFSNVNFLADDNSWQWGGYALAHEWGHYFYSLYDEYKGHPKYDNVFHMPHSTDDPVPDSIMNSQWNARGGHFEWLNFSTARNNTRNTAQHRVYDASGWETLGRPVTEDPRDGERRALPKRIYYPELAAVAPGANDAPRIDLPGTARSDLEIVWISQDVTYQIVLDHSGSMGEEDKMENAKIATKMLVDLAPINRAKIGIIMFDDRVEVVQPLTAVDSQATKDAIKAKVDVIQPANRTAIGDAARKALEDLLVAGSSGTTRVVYLLTDGLSNSGIDPLSVIPEYQSAGIPLFTFGYGSDADTGLLQRMAQETGGKFYSAPATLAGLTQAFQDANQLAAPSVGVAAGSVQVQSGALSSIPLFVDSTLNRLTLAVTYQGAPSALGLALVDPMGHPVGGGDCYASGSETLCYFSVDGPSPGTWTLKASTTNSDVLLVYRVSGSSENAITYAASVSSLTGDVVRYPEPIVLLAVLTKELPISGAVLTATLQGPDGSAAMFPMLDNGVAPDAVADDGLYSAVLDYSVSGVYDVTVQFDNSAHTAHLTYEGLQPSSGPGGKPIPFPPPVPIAENFQRAARLQVTVVGVASDDHGNTQNDATFLPLDNSDLPGRIDYSNDVDVFAVRTSVAGEVMVSVSNLALGMNPRLRILAADGVTVLDEGDLSTRATPRGYLAVPVHVNAGETIYAEVSHQGSEYGGRYYISAGQRISGDGAQGDGTGDQSTLVPIQPLSAALALVLVLAITAVGGLVYAASRPATMPSAGLQVVQGQALRPYVGIRRGRLLIGRAPDCDLRLPHPTVSSHHAVIQQTPRGYMITDLRSTNHTYVNGKEVSQCMLQPGDEIRVGNVRLKFVISRK